MSVFNKLIARANLSLQDITLLVAWTAYLRQIGVIYTSQYIGETLVKYPGIASLIVSVFKIKFALDINFNRDEALVAVYERIESQRANIDNIAEDNIVRCFLEIVGKAMVRTNFYQIAQNNKPKTYYSFKILSITR